VRARCGVRLLKRNKSARRSHRVKSQVCTRVRFAKLLQEGYHRFSRGISQSRSLLCIARCCRKSLLFRCDDAAAVQVVAQRAIWCARAERLKPLGMRHSVPSLPPLNDVKQILTGDTALRRARLYRDQLSATDLLDLTIAHMTLLAPQLQGR
jgi:hypothetical protein